MSLLLPVGVSDRRRQEEVRARGKGEDGVSRFVQPWQWPLAHGFISERGSVTLFSPHTLQAPF